VSGRWREVVRLKFKGERFRDHALDLSALAELSQFQRIVAETAKALWRAENPDRERLPAHFEERTRLCLRKIEEGSAVAPLEVFIAEPEEPELFEIDTPEVTQAIGVAKRVFQAAENDEPLPDDLPRSVLGEFAKWGQGLFEDEQIQIETPMDDKPAVVTHRSRASLLAFEDVPHEAYADITGETLEADVRQRRFQLWIDERTPVAATFSPELEDQVTAALRDHKTTKVHLVGRAEFSPQGKPVRLIDIETWELVPFNGTQIDESARPIEQILAELAGEVPEGDWKRLPNDLTTYLDHYLYGTPKR
jgi:hypothetical protein